MLTGKRRTDRVRQAITTLLEQEQHPNGFSPADVNRILRAENQPMGAWEVRGELSLLERLGELELNPETGQWFLAEQRKRA